MADKLNFENDPFFFEGYDRSYPIMCKYNEYGVTLYCLNLNVIIWKLKNYLISKCPYEHITSFF